MNIPHRSTDDTLSGDPPDRCPICLRDLDDDGKCPLHTNQPEPEPTIHNDD